MSPDKFFHASQRGGPLMEPMPQRGLTDFERERPENIKGPSLLYRGKFGAKKSEWVKYKELALGIGDVGGNMLEDDNPFNDPFKYHPFKGMAFPPSDYIGPDDPRETDDMSQLRPGNALRLQFVYGYTARKGCRSNLFYNKDGRIVYHSAALGIVYDKEKHEQWFFHGHDDDITALAISPKDQLTICTGQMGKDPKILVWKSRPDGKTRHLPQLCIIHGDHKRAILGLSFSQSGEYIASIGNDNNRSIGFYKWKKDTPLEQMRVGLDKGHNDEVYHLAYNPVTDHVVAGGKKLLRFFGIKEDPSESESKLWQKKGTYGKDKKGVDRGAQDVTALTFDHNGVIYVGSATGFIFRFSEQATDLAVQAHPLADGSTDWPHPLCRVTALWFDPHRKALLSSGDDGWLHEWGTPNWPEAGSQKEPKPTRSFNLNAWVTRELKGTIVKMDDKELDKADPVRGRPAAAYSIHGDAAGNLIIGTVCNEIYELNLDQPATAPTCYVQGHYDEMWGLAMHPLKNEFCSGAEDETLRVWDPAQRTILAMAKLGGPARCCAYSPDGSLIAVGIGGKFAKHKLSGKWLLLSSTDLSVVHEPPHTRFERVSDIKFAPDGRHVAVANADNGIDVYELSDGGRGGVRRIGKLEGHSSFVNHIDFSADSLKLQSNCGAHELLYWKLKPRPHQEKSSSSMRDEQWHTQTCIYGWYVRGLWPEGADGTDINACARSNTGARELIVTSDDFGKVKLFRYPSIIAYADNKPYSGHSSHVTNVGFTPDDSFVISAGGEDRALMQWEVVTE